LTFTFPADCHCLLCWGREEDILMAGDSDTQLQGLIDRLAAGDPAAREELIARAHKRLERLARKLLQGFPGVRRFEDTGDVLDGSVPRLLQAVKSVAPASVAEFFRLASRQMRWELHDLVQRYYGPNGPGRKEMPAGGQSGPDATAPLEKPATTHDPARLASWAEFHKAVESLPEAERQVFELLWYQEMTHAAAAAVLHISESSVRRHWLAARRRLAAFTPGGAAG
jgi:RNA polymerase sigma factor (sigma-70 family)